MPTDESAGEEARTLRVDGTWDIETEAWSTFVCGALYAPGEAERIKVYSWREEERFVDELLSRKRVLYAHNGGRFDTLWLLGHVMKRGLVAKIGLSGSSIASLEVGGAVFRDSARLIPMSLKKAAEMGGEQKAETGLPCSCAKACGGYCSIRRGMAPALYKRLTDYLVQDCHSLYRALDTVCTLADRHGIVLRPTIGASAWATVHAQGVEKANWGRSIFVTPAYRNTRSAYFGGRTQVFRPKSQSGYHYDINSAYPAALANLSLPVGERRELFGDEASRAYASGQLGAFRASVHVPRDLFLPPLPVRTRERVAYPIGDVSGWWTGLELQAAERRGATIRRVDGAVAWADHAMVLAPFCRHVWALRDAAGPKTALGTWYKFLANSLTGKLASKPINERVSVDPGQVVFCPGGKCRARGPLCGVIACCEHRCAGHCGRATPIAAGFPIFAVKQERLSACSHVEWAAYLTAYARVELETFAGEDDDIVYCDTDSLFCEKPRMRNIGKDLGQWKLEDIYRDFYALAPKTYAYTDEVTGETHAASKGIPDAVTNISLLAAGGSVLNDRGVNTFKRALQVGELFQRRMLERRVKSDGVHFGDRVLATDGRTMPREL